MKLTIIISFLLIIVITIFDYADIPTLLGLNISNMNWDFYMGILNVMAVVVIFIITYKKINQRETEEEKNKYDISMMLLIDCYEECKNVK